MGIGLSAGEIPANHCRWTKEGGVWKVESNCGSGKKCMLLNKVQGSQIVDGQVVSLTAQGTLSGEFGLVDATFTELLAKRNIEITELVSNVAVESAAEAPNGSHLDIPCVPANDTPIVFTSAQPHYGLPT